MPLQLTLFHKKTALKVRERKNGALFILAQKEDGEKFDFSARNSNNIVILLSPIELASVCLVFQNPQKNKFDTVHPTENATKVIRVQQRDEGYEIFVSEKRGETKRNISFQLTKPEAYLLSRLAQLLIDKSFSVQRDDGNNAGGEKDDAQVSDEAVVEEDVMQLGW